MNVDEANLLFISRLTVTSFSKYEVIHALVFMYGRRRMKEPEDTPTEH